MTKKKRRMLISTLAYFDKDKSIKEKLLYKCRLDASNGLLVWPANIPKGYHLHYYPDSKTGEQKVHLKNEKRTIEIPFSLSFREMEDVLFNEASHDFL